jgi:2-keto-4-pentenoate hydratase/2-oxohepta-3-ene-1,7-dioic acid hydratase in catechol pathway
MNLSGGCDECSSHQVGPVKAWTANGNDKPNRLNMDCQQNGQTKQLNTSTIRITQIEQMLEILSAALHAFLAPP